MEALKNTQKIVIESGWFSDFDGVHYFINALSKRFNKEIKLTDCEVIVSSTEFYQVRYARQ